MIARVNIPDGIDVRTLTSYLKVMRDFVISKEDQEALSNTVDIMESLLCADTRTDSQVFYDLEHKWDVEYIRDNLAEYVESDRYPDMKERLRSDGDLCDRVAFRYRRYLDECVTGEDEVDCFLCAYRYCTGD